MPLFKNIMYGRKKNGLPVFYFCACIDVNELLSKELSAYNSRSRSAFFTLGNTRNIESKSCAVEETERSICVVRIQIVLLKIIYFLYRGIFINCTFILTRDLNFILLLLFFFCWRHR